MFKPVACEFREPSPNWRKFVPNAEVSPILELQLLIGINTLNFSPTIGAFGSAIDITAQELKIENYFPADQHSRDFFESLIM